MRIGSGQEFVIGVLTADDDFVSAVVGYYSRAGWRNAPESKNDTRVTLHPSGVQSGACGTGRSTFRFMLLPQISRGFGDPGLKHKVVSQRVVGISHAVS